MNELKAKISRWRKQAANGERGANLLRMMDMLPQVDAAARAVQYEEEVDMLRSYVRGLTERARLLIPLAHRDRFLRPRLSVMACRLERKRAAFCPARRKGHPAETQEILDRYGDATERMRIREAAAVPDRVFEALAEQAVKAGRCISLRELRKHAKPGVKL